MTHEKRSFLYQLGRTWENNFNWGISPQFHDTLSLTLELPIIDQNQYHHMTQSSEPAQIIGSLRYFYTFWWADFVP